MLSSNHTKAFVQCCHGKCTMASLRTLLSDHVYIYIYIYVKLYVSEVNSQLRTATPLHYNTIFTLKIYSIIIQQQPC